MCKYLGPLIGSQKVTQREKECGPAVRVGLSKWVGTAVTQNEC